MIIYNGVVHPMDGPVIPRGYVTFEGGKITAVGPMEELGETPEGLDAQGRAYPARVYRRPLPSGAVW